MSNRKERGQKGGGVQRDRNVGIICGKIYDDVELEACTQRRERKREREREREIHDILLTTKVRHLRNRNGCPSSERL